MHHPDHDFHLLTQRLETLERQNARLHRRLRLLIAAVVAIPVVGVMLGAAPRKPAKSLAAEEFLLQEPNGKVRGALRIEESGPSFVLFNSDEKTAAFLRVYDRKQPTTSFGLLYPNEKAAYMMVVNPDFPTFGIRGTHGKFYYHVGKVTNAAPPTIDLFDENGNRIQSWGSADPPK